MVCVDEVAVVMGHCVHKHEARVGVWAKKLKLSHYGSISGALCKMVKGDGGEVCMR